MGWESCVQCGMCSKSMAMAMALCFCRFFFRGDLSAMPTPPSDYKKRDINDIICIFGTFFFFYLLFIIYYMIPTESKVYVNYH